jgi:hypothetical protein
VPHARYRVRAFFLFAPGGRLLAPLWPLIARSSKTKVRKPLIQGHELGSSHQLMSQLSSDSHISFMTRATMLEKIFTAQTSDTLALINAPFILKREEDDSTFQALGLCVAR